MLKYSLRMKGVRCNSQSGWGSETDILKSGLSYGVRGGVDEPI
jgi:hypothetical protein